MLEALCRQSSTTLDIVHAEDGPPITQRTSGLVHYNKIAATEFYVVQSQPLYNYYDYPVGPAVRLGCYLPSDGCLSEYSVQN